MIDPPFSALMRLIWIDATLADTGRLNRADICAAFAISIPQAAVDLNVFRTEFPDRMAYDFRHKVYRCAPGSRPAYPTEARDAVHRAVRAVRAVRAIS